MTAIRTALFGACLLLSSPAFAEDQAKAAPAAEAEKKVCRYEGSTGSMMRKRTCHTVSEWKQIEAVNAANARTMIDRNNMNRPAVGGS